MTAAAEGIRIIGYALVHFVWQGALVAVVAAGCLRLLRSRSAAARYAVASGALAAMLAMPMATVVVLWQSGGAGVEVPGAVQQADAPETTAAIGQGSAIPAHRPALAGRAGFERFLPYVVLVWMLGVTLLLGRMAGGLWRVHRLQASALATRACRWQPAVERLAARMGLRVRLHVVELAGVDVPATVGWLRPVVLLPIAALANLTPLQVEAILVHELAHIRRHDYVVNLIQTLAETLLFYHPGVWWLSARLRAERELCCDDVAVEVCGDPVDYAAALTELETWRTGGAGLAPAATSGSLARRVRRLLDTPPERSSRPASGLVAAGLTAALVVGVALHSTALVPAAAGDAEPRREEPIASPDSFDWRVRPTEHYEIHYYPALEDDLSLVEVAAEQAYRRVSAELSRGLSFRVPLVLFATRDDFEQQEIAPGANLEWVTAFSEPDRNRIVLLVAECGDLYQRITHELVHIFVFQVVPRDNLRVPVPVWMDEGLAEYVMGVWAAEELLELRRMVEAGTVPDMSTLRPTDQRANEDGASPIARAVTLGHAAFEFIEMRYGRDRIQQFPQALRKTFVEDDRDLYREAFDTTAGEFDAAFRRYLEERFGGADQKTGLENRVPEGNTTSQ